MCVCVKHRSRTWISNYIPQYLWDEITNPCPRQMLQIYKSSSMASNPESYSHMVSLKVNSDLL